MKGPLANPLKNGGFLSDIYAESLSSKTSTAFNFGGVP